MFFLAIAAAAVAYLNVGYHLFGKAGHRLWHRRKRERLVEGAAPRCGIADWLHFPFAAASGKVGADGWGPFVDDDGTEASERSYAAMMAMVWPFKLAANAQICSAFALSSAVMNGVGGGIWLVAEAPAAALRRLTGRRRSILDAPTIVNRKMVERHTLRKELNEIDEDLDLEAKFRRLEATEKKTPAE